MRTDWRSSDPSTARRRPTSHPPEVRARCRNRIGAARQSPQFVRSVNEDGIGEGCGFSGGGKGDDFDGPADIHFLTDGYQFLKLNRWYPLSLSYRNPFQPIFPSPPTHAASSAMPQERSLTVLGPFVCLFMMLWSYQHLVSCFSQRCWDARSQESRPVALHVL